MGRGFVVSGSIEAHHRMAEFFQYLRRRRSNRTSIGVCQLNQAYRLVAEGGIVFSGLNQLVDFIDGHLIEEIHADDLAVSLGMTEYHLRRMFSSLAGMPLSGYVRRRRMTVAAADVLEKGELLAIAVRYG